MLPKKLLESLEIKNFRGFKHLQVEKLGHVNLIVGQNNVGKSSVLEALQIYAGFANPHLLSNLAHARGESLPPDYSPDTPNDHLSTNEDDFRPSSPFESFFFGREYKGSDLAISIGELRDESPPLEIFQGYRTEEIITDKTGDSGQETPRTIRVQIIDKDVFEQRNALETPSDLPSIPVLITRKGDVRNYFGLTTKYLRRFNQNPLKILPCSYAPPNISNELTQSLAKDWDNILFTPSEDTVVDALKILEPKLQKLAFTGEQKNRSPVVQIQGLKGRVPLLSMGDGMSRVLQLSIKTVTAKDGFLLIDEFENGLHHSTQKKLWELIFTLAKELNIQVFAATHSLDCLKAFSVVAQERTDMEGVVFRLGRSAMKSNKGDIIATVMDEESLTHLLSMEYEVR